MKRILLRLPNWLGDALLARPALHAVRRAWPDAETWAVGPAAFAPLLEADGQFDRYEPWSAAASQRAALAQRTRAFAPEGALVLPPSFSSAWWALRSGAPVRVGFAGDARDLLLTRALRRPPRGDQHLSQEYLALATALGVPEAPLRPAPALALPAASVQEARAALQTIGITPAEPYAVLGPGAIYGPAKRWSAERFGAIGARLQHSGLRVVVCGTAQEADTCESVARPHGLGVLAGRTSLLAQAGLCAGAALAVCNDSGLAHLSAACGTRTIVVFGSTSSAWTAPLGAQVRIVQRPPVCSPCFQRTCRIGYRCLDAVSVDAVWRACEVAA